MVNETEELQKLIEQIGHGRYSILIFLVCGTAWSSIYMWASCVSISIKEAGAEWNLSGLEQGIMGSVHTFGIFVGSYFWGHIGNIKGRLWGMKRCAIMSCIVGILYVFSVNFEMMVPSTILIGFSTGGSVVLAGTLYSEMLPNNKRWTLVLLSAVMVCGACVVYAAALLFLASGTFGIGLWRWTAAVAFCFQLVFTLYTMRIYESPKFLIKIDLREEAYDILQKIAKYNRKPIEMPLINYIKGINSNEDTSTYHAKGKLSDLFISKHLKATLLFTVVLIKQSMFFSDLSFSALSTFMPILLEKVGTQSLTDFEIYATVLAQISLGIPGSIASAYLVKTFLGKKWTTSIAFVVTALFVFFFLASNQYWMVLVSTSFISFFNFVGYSGLMAIITESYPVKIRSLGVGWANAWCKFGGIVSPVTVGLLIESSQGTVIAVLLISFCFLVVGVISAFFKEPVPKAINTSELNKF